MKLEDFEKLQKIADDEVSMPDTFEAIMIKNNLLPALVQKWTKLYEKQKFIVANLNIDSLKLYGELLQLYKYGNGKSSNPYGINLNYAWTTTKEIESQINTVPAYIDLIKEINLQKYILDYIEKTLDTIKNLSFAIRNYIEYKKIIMANY